MQIWSKSSGVGLRTILGKTSWWIWIFLAQIPYLTSNKHNPSSGYLWKIHFLDILMINLGLSSFKNPYLTRQWQVKGVNWSFCWQFSPKFHFLVKVQCSRRMHTKKSSMWLHFYNCDTALKMLKIPPNVSDSAYCLPSYKRISIVSNLYFLACLFIFDQVSMLTCK